MNKHIVVTEPENMIIRDGEIPAPREGEILLRTEICGVCGSDIGLYFGEMSGYATYPRIPGHEVAARVVEINAEREDLKPGDLVTINPYFNCGKCYSCRRGHVNCCVNNRTMGLPIDGAFRQYFTMPQERVYLSEGLTEEETVLVEPFCIGYHAAKVAMPNAGDRALVIGAGAIGIFTMLSLKLMGCEVYTANRSEGRLKKALEIGADGAFSYSGEEDLLQKTDEITDSDGFDIVVDAVGDPKVLNMAVKAAAHRARIVEVGISSENAAFPMSTIEKKELIIMGSRNALKKDFEEVMELIRSGKARVLPMITGKYQIDDCIGMFEKIRADKTTLKNIVYFK